jgi:hypothetical protein
MSRGPIWGPDIVCMINASKKIQGKPHDTTQLRIDNQIILIIFFDHLLPMPHNFIPISRKWAALLVGLCMEVPNYWWPAFSGQALNAGIIAGVDFNIETDNHFQLKLDNEQGVYYAMHYAAIVHFADKMHCSFSSFCLPSHAICNLVDDVVEVETVNDDNDDDNDFVTPPTRNNRRRLKYRQQTTINPDLRELVGKDGIEDEPGRADKPGRVQAPHCKFMMTKKEDWWVFATVKIPLSLSLSLLTASGVITPLRQVSLSQSLMSVSYALFDAEEDIFEVDWYDKKLLNLRNIFVFNVKVIYHL